MNKTSKDMSKVYRNTSSPDLIKNRMKKRFRAENLKKEHGYWAKKEVARLENMIAQIDAELECRAGLNRLF